MGLAANESRQQRATDQNPNAPHKYAGY
jgi:hypothetical protein